MADGEGGLLRVSLEQVNGEWQGAAWPFVKNLGVAASRFAFNVDGQLYVGGAGAAGKGLGLARISAPGAADFEVKSVKALADGFELTFTQPVEAASAAKAAGYEVSQFSYQHDVGPGAEHDFEGTMNKTSALQVSAASVSSNGLSARLTVPSLRAGFVTSVRAAGVRSAAAQPLRHDTFFYTLNQLPK